jgi:hypothetical protein
MEIEACDNIDNLSDARAREEKKFPCKNYFVEKEKKVLSCEEKFGRPKLKNYAPTSPINSTTIFPLLMFSAERNV